MSFPFGFVFVFVSVLPVLFHIFCEEFFAIGKSCRDENQCQAMTSQKTSVFLGVFFPLFFFLVGGEGKKFNQQKEKNKEKKQRKIAFRKLPLKGLLWRTNVVILKLN